MKNTIKRTLTGILALASTLSPLQSRAGADVGYLADRDKSCSYLESTYSADLPLKAGLSGFMDLMENDQGYFGKAALTVPATKNLSARAQLVSVNSPVSEGGLGVKATIPNLPSRVYANVTAMPIWADSDGLQKIDSAKIGYFVSVDLPRNFAAWTCGEIKPFQSGGAAWAYGETEIAKKIGNLSVGVNVAMLNAGEGELAPKLSPRLVARWKF